MKCCKSLFSQFKIYSSTPMNCTSIFFFYTTMISCFFMIKQFFTYPACLTWPKAFFLLFSHDQVLLKNFFHYFFTVTKLLKPHLNKIINCVLAPVNNNWMLNLLLNLLSTQACLKAKLHGMWSWYFSVQVWYLIFKCLMWHQGKHFWSLFLILINPFFGLFNLAGNLK